MDLQKTKRRGIRVKKAVIAVYIALYTMLPLFIGCAQNSEETASMPERIVAAQEGAATSAQSQPPIPKADGTPHRIGVIDIDPYPYSSKMMYELIQALRERGWIITGELPFDDESMDVREMIDWLARQDTGPHVEFVVDCNYYLAYDGEQAVKESLDRHIYELKDIDMLLALGTWPATVALPYSSDVPVICYPLSAAQESGIVKTHEYSGVQNVWAQTDPERYKRQMKVFHEVLSFSKIGILYYDRLMAAVGDYEESAARLGVEVLTEEIEPLPSDPQEADIVAFNEAIIKGVGNLLTQGIDAFLLTTDIIKDDDTLARLLAQTDAKGVPVCVQSGDNFVEGGCLLTVDVYNLEELGFFVVDTIAQIFHGAKPEELPQINVSTPYLVLNLDSFKKLEIQAPFELLMSSEKIFFSQG